MNGINVGTVIVWIIPIIISLLAPYISWKNLKNSQEGTPPEFLKYEKWLDVIEKRHEVLKNIPDNLKKDNSLNDKEDIFVKTLELYERNAIWEGKVLENTPKGSYRTFLLKLDPQETSERNAQKENTASSGTFYLSGIHIVLYLLSLFIFGGSSVVIFIIIVTISDQYSGYDIRNDIAFPGILIIWWNLILFILSSLLILNKPKISELYYHRIQDKILDDLPNLWKVFVRSLHIVLTSTGPFPKIKTNQWRILLRAFIVGCIGLISSLAASINIVYGALLILAYNKDNTINLHNLKYDTLLSFLGCITVSIILILFLIKSFYFSNTSLGEYELKSLDGEWKEVGSSGSIFIKDGTLTLRQEEKEYKFELSINNMRKIHNNESTKLVGYRINSKKDNKKKIKIESKNKLVYLIDKSGKIYTFKEI
ncbi:hypothetical protein [Rothia dentocariosa]|uniref:hypothetical protein n=1 Tax=Rothia dentocariosa TaxID=2047 RepID=UPI0028809942|nr:hypothetical protein [Rothia dentocariosa]